MSNANDVGMTDAAPMTTLPIATSTCVAPQVGRERERDVSVSRASVSSLGERRADRNVFWNVFRALPIGTFLLPGKLSLECTRMGMR